MNRAQAPAHVLLLAACTALSGCGLNQEGVAPPSDTIAYPASAILDRGQNWLFVTNSNADLRYNDGTLIALSLARAAIDRDPNGPTFGYWNDCRTVSDVNPRTDPTHFCCWDVINGERDVLNCDERYYIGPDDDAMDDSNDGRKRRGRGNVRIGSFAAGMVLHQRNCNAMVDPSCSDLCQDNADSINYPDRLFIGVRGDTSLTYVDVAPSGATNPPALHCTNQDAQDFDACDDSHRINTAGSALAGVTDEKDPPKVTLPDEPYALAVDDRTGLLFIGHLTGNTARALTGGFSLFDVLSPDTPRFIAPFPSPFAANSVGSVGVTNMRFENNSDDNLDGIYASSRFSPQVSRLGVTATCGDIREIAAFPDGTTYNSPLVGSETRGIEFSEGRAFVLQRTPPALIAFTDQYTATDVLETCASPTFLDKHDNGVGDRLFVTCFADGEIYVFEPSVPRLVKSFSVGRGPSGLVFDDGRQVAYVVGFGDNNISVIDLKPGSETEYQVVQRLGFPRVSPR